MKELAEALKGRAGLRMRQGVVTAVRRHLQRAHRRLGDGGRRRAAPQQLRAGRGDVVWIASDGADLWIIGTHGDPPPIDPSRLPAFDDVLRRRPTPRGPGAVTGVGASPPDRGDAPWDLPAEAMWRSWEVQGTPRPTSRPGAPSLPTTATSVVAPDPGSRAVALQGARLNSRGEASADVEAGPFTLPALPDVELGPGSVHAENMAAGAVDLASAVVSGQLLAASLADNAVTQDKLAGAVSDAIAAAQSAADAADAAAGAAMTEAATGTIAASRLVAGSIQAAKLDVADVQAAVVTAAKVNALSIDAAAIKAGTLDVARLGAGSVSANEINVASVQAAVVTAAKVNALALSAGAITTGTMDADRIAAGTIQAIHCDVANLQANIVTAARINTLALSASIIQAGTIATARLNAAEIQTAVVTAAKINALALNAVTITGGSITGVTVTGATLQTASSGPRVKISTDLVSRVQLFSGVSGEVLPGLLGGASDGYGGSFVELASADFGGGSALLHLTANPSTGTRASISANAAALTVGHEGYAVRVDAHLNVAGRICPAGNWGSGTSWDGLWVQDKTVLGAVWKMYFDSGNKRLYLRNGGTWYSALLS